MLKRLKQWLDDRAQARTLRRVGRAEGHAHFTDADGPAALDMLVRMLVEFEGYRSAAYQCSGGRWTFGYGSTFHPGGRPVQENDRISEPHARALLTETAVTCLNHARDLLDGHAPTQGCLAAVASLIYNVGPVAVAGSRFLAAWKRCDMEQAHVEFVDFNRSGGKVVAGLTSRRLKEWAVLTGKATP